MFGARRRITAVLVAGMVAGGVVVTTIVGGGGGGGATANVWVEVGGGACTRASTPVTFADIGTNGVDEVCGSPDTAWTAMSSGDTGRIRPGTYAELHDFTSDKASLTKLIGDDRETVILRAGGAVTDCIFPSGGPFDLSFICQEANNFWLENVTIDAQTSHGQAIASRIDAATLTTYKNVDITGNYVAVRPVAGAWHWDGGTFGDPALFSERRCDTDDGQPIWVEGDADGTIIEDITFHPQNTAVGTDPSCGGDNTLHLETIRLQSVTNVTIRRNRFLEGSEVGSGHIFFSSGSPTGVAGVKIIGNLFERGEHFYWAQTGGSMTGGTCGAGFVVAYNTFRTNQSGCNWAGSSWVGNLGVDQDCNGGSGTNVKNVYQRPTGTSCGTNTYVTGPDYAAFTTDDSGSENLDIDFTTGALQADSEAINAGETTVCAGDVQALDFYGSSRPLGGANCDAGFYEYEEAPAEPFLMISAEDFAALPMSGTGWTNVNQYADLALSEINFTANGSGIPADDNSPQLRNYQDSGFTATRFLQKLLMLAIRWARENVAGTADPADRAFVVDGLEFVIGTEELASTDGTSSNDGLLSTARNTFAIPVIADLINLDGDATFGSRAGTSSKSETFHENPIQGDAWTATSFNDWLAALAHSHVGTRTNWRTLRQNSYVNATNQGAAALMSRTAIALYLDKEGWTAPSTETGTLWVNGQVLGGTAAPELDAVVESWRRWMGDLSATYDPPAGEQAHFSNISTAAEGLTTGWWCIPGGESWGADIWRPINPDTCANDKDGVVIDDIARSSLEYPDYGTSTSSGVTYTNEHYGFLLAAARVMQVAGYPVETWSDGISATPTLRRIGDWVQAEGLWPAFGGSGIHREAAGMANWVLGTSYSSLTAELGRAFSGGGYLSGAE